MTVFSATFSAVAVTAAQDVFEIVAASGGRKRVAIREIRLGQYTDFGDAAAEILSVLVIRGYTTTGSGGAAVTPANFESTSRAADSTVARNNTTPASNGTAVTLIADAMNIAAGFVWKADPANGNDLIWLTGGERLVVRITAPADSITLNGTLIFEEF